jgi:hypothetical protein
MSLPFRCTAAAVVVTVVGSAAAAPNAIPPTLGRIPAEVAALSLPTGKLIALSGSPRQLTFEDVDRSAFTRSGGVVVTYDVPNPPIPTAQGPAVQLVRRFRVSCASQTVQQLGVMAYGRGGNVVMWLPADAPQPARGDGMAEAHLKLVCGGAHPPSAPVMGYRAAFAYATQVLASWAERGE